MSTSSTTERLPPAGLLHVGRLARPHGVRGAMYVHLYSDHPDRSAPGARLWAAGEWYVIATSKKQADRWLIEFVDLVDRNDAQRLVNQDLYGEPIQDPSVLWVHEMIGSEVVGIDGVHYGTCVGVIDNPAHPIIELDTGGLVPVPFVVSHADGRITIDPPQGLFDQ
ncbi:MAG: ribosome maturation factor RimM [Ilumatobacteraceae bacterium]